MKNERKHQFNFIFHAASFFPTNFTVSQKKKSQLYKTIPHNSGTVVCCIELYPIDYLSENIISLSLVEGKPIYHNFLTQ